MQKKDKYTRFLKRLTKTKSLRHMKSLIQNYAKDDSNYMPTTRTTDAMGDCNGDGSIDILDIVVLVNFVLHGVSPYAEHILNRCNIRYDTNAGVLIPSGESIPNVLDVVSLVQFVLYSHQADGGASDGEDDVQPLDLVYDDEELKERVYGYQWAQYGYDYETAFSTTNGNEVSDEVYSHELIDSPFHPQYMNRVLITAPHAQRVYRPTRWDKDHVTDQVNNPSAGLYHCSSNSDTSCHKGADTCTGAMAKVLSEITGAPYLSTRNKQEDPNYYDHIGYDYNGYAAVSNVGSGNKADPEQGHYNYGGIQTDVFSMGMNHPFKSELSQYLNNHPEIKLVIDLHGSSSTTNHWDVDFGLLGDNGNDGTMNLNEADIGGFYPSIPYELLSSMVDTLHRHEIGLCNHDCADGNTDLGDCEKYSSNCPPGVIGHGPISFNDFAAANQDTVTKYVNYFHEGVNSIQVETASIYRCLGTSDENDVVRYMRALQEIVYVSNMYYNNVERG